MLFFCYYLYMAMTYANRIRRQAESMYGKATTESSNTKVGKFCRKCKELKFDTQDVRTDKSEGFPEYHCGDCRNESTEPLYECGGCERKVNVVEGAFCSDCFSRGARATARW
jgi:hypothetical protein